MGRSTFLPRRIEGVRSPALAEDRMVRLCDSERDAFLASVTLSGLTYDEIGARIGVSKQAVNKWARNGVPHARVKAFCNATGTLLLEQYIRVELAKRQVYGQLREADRIAAIVQVAA